MNVIPELPPRQQPNKEVKPLEKEGVSFAPIINVRTLPSKMLPYPKGAGITYRPYLYGEVKGLSSSKLTALQMVQYAMEGVTTSFDKQLLTLSDAIFIALLRKISTLGTTKFTVGYECDGCEKPQKFTIPSDEIEFEDLSMDKLPVVARLTAGELKFSPLTFGGYAKMVEEGRVGDPVWALAYMCCSLPLEEAYKVLYGAPPADMEVLEEVDRLLYHGVKSREEVCPACKAVNYVELDGGDVFIGPFRESSQPRESRIRFGD